LRRFQTFLSQHGLVCKIFLLHSTLFEVLDIVTTTRCPSRPSPFAEITPLVALPCTEDYTVLQQQTWLSFHPTTTRVDHRLRQADSTWHGSRSKSHQSLCYYFGRFKGDPVLSHDRFTFSEPPYPTVSSRILCRGIHNLTHHTGCHQYWLRWCLEKWSR
jgi:hypothetical protein